MSLPARFVKRYRIPVPDLFFIEYKSGTFTVVAPLVTIRFTLKTFGEDMLSCSNCLALLTTVSLIVGCGGLDLREGMVPAGDAGYQLYYPKILVTVSAERQCIKPGAGGACPDGNWKYNCVMSKPWVLPDYSKPYVAKFKSGLGSQSASILIVDGWMLGQASSATDVSALTTTLLESAAEDANNGCNARTYEWTATGFQLFELPKN